MQVESVESDYGGQQARVCAGSAVNVTAVAYGVIVGDKHITPNEALRLAQQLIEAHKWSQILADKESRK